MLQMCGSPKLDDLETSDFDPQIHQDFGIKGWTSMFWFNLWVAKRSLKSLTHIYIYEYIYIYTYMFFLSLWISKPKTTCHIYPDAPGHWRCPDGQTSWDCRSIGAGCCRGIGIETSKGGDQRRGWRCLDWRGERCVQVERIFFLLLLLLEGGGRIW